MFCIALLPIAAQAAEPDPVVRSLPYPFSHVVSFISDVDEQRPWHGAAIHRVFNEDLGLTISDSLWPQGGTPLTSALFLGPGRLNRRNSGAGSEPTFALLLRQWHRGNIDHFHGWSEDGVLQLQNQIDPPLALSAVRTSQELPKVPVAISGQEAQSVRFYFSAEPPADLTIALHDTQGKSISFNSGSIGRGKKVLVRVGKLGWIVEAIVPSADSGSTPLAINPMLIDRVDFIAPSCAGGCPVSLTRVERDHFSRQIVLDEIPWLKRWNIRPQITTSHGGNTLISGFGIEGAALDLPRTPGTFLTDPATVVHREAMADRIDTYAYYSDLLRELSVRAVWSYFPAHGTDQYSFVLSDSTASDLTNLTTTYNGLYDVRRTSISNFDPSSVQAFADGMRLTAPEMSEEDRRSLYCAPTCDISQGDALPVLLSDSLYLINKGQKVRHFWYTHFGSGGSGFKASQEEPLTPKTLKWIRKLANQVYNFDGSVSLDRRPWSPPANTWFGYQIMQAGIKPNLKVGAGGSSVEITPWKDPVTHVTVPNLKAGTRDLHGLTLYVRDPEQASVDVGGKSVDTFTRNPPDETGKPSITIVGDNAPTPIIGKVALHDRGDVEIRSGKFVDATPANDFVSLEADAAGQAEIVFEPWSLDLWNTSHLHFAIRKRLSTAGSSAASSDAALKIEMLMEDGGVVTALESAQPPADHEGSSVWVVPPLTVPDQWRTHTLDVARLAWPKPLANQQDWRRPPLPLGRVREVRISLANAAPGEAIDIRDLKALHPSGNGEAPDGGKLIAGRVTRDGSAPLALVPVQLTSSSGEVVDTTTDVDGYYFFYHRRREEQLTIRALGSSGLSCFPQQGRKIEVVKNEAELDIAINECRH
ncbi:carboxypeptidase-like regulatory domain-containing protein [Bradyrhizobium sp. Pha-3]|uniref:carboxypeptidase-like regulatory domain-containing protein n=1 Tax=Bradyrhizobium sp. Pha-3 TaxID=208375 RepID=UPI0035D3FFD3